MGPEVRNQNKTRGWVVLYLFRMQQTWKGDCAYSFINGTFKISDDWINLTFFSIVTFKFKSQRENLNRIFVMLVIIFQRISMHWLFLFYDSKIWQYITVSSFHTLRGRGGSRQRYHVHLRLAGSNLKILRFFFLRL